MSWRVNEAGELVSQEPGWEIAFDDGVGDYNLLGKEKSFCASNMKYQKSYSALGTASLRPGLVYDLVNKAREKFCLRIP